MIYGLALLWWISGVSSVLWMERGHDITWGDLALSSMFGFVGPALWFIVGIVIIAQADFWGRPIFPKRSS